MTQPQRQATHAQGERVNHHLTINQLIAIMPKARTQARLFIHELNEAMFEFGINNLNRRAAFLAQVAHESGQLRYLSELGNGSQYEGRKDLGNFSPGDGERFKGRGLIQLTGRYNYGACGAALGLNLVMHPELLTFPGPSCRSAGWFWNTRDLNLLADRGDLIAITRRINGGVNGLEERMFFYETAKKVLA